MIAVENQIIAGKRSWNEMLYMDEKNIHEYANHWDIGGTVKKRCRVTFDLKKSSSIPSVSKWTQEEVKESCWLSLVEYQTIRSSVMETVHAFTTTTTTLQQQQEQQPSSFLKNEEESVSNICIRGIEHYVSEDVANERSRNRCIYRRMMILKHRLEQYTNTGPTTTSNDVPVVVDDDDSTSSSSTSSSSSTTEFEQKIRSVFGSSANAHAVMEECCSAQAILTLADAQKAHAVDYTMQSKRPTSTTITSNCSIYDGWMDGWMEDDDSKM